MRANIIKSVIAVFIISLLIATSALAQKPAVMISTVSVDLDAGIMTITGKNFDIGPNPTTVTLGGFGNLNITSNNGTMLVVSFQEGLIPPGTYLLSVSSGPGPKKNAEQSITIGVQGPEGNPGDPGTPGDPGEQGPQGPQGVPGPQGPQGESGPQGLKGDSGDTGPMGPAGEKGDKGDPGDTGADGAVGAGFAVIASAPDQGVCPNDQGVKYESGPDADNDGVPDSILFTNHVCDGAQGPQGIGGLNGADGQDGAPGAQGMKGDTGNTGPVGAQGMKGDTGDPGDDGVDGNDGTGFGVFAKNVLLDCDGNGNPGTEFQIFHDINNNGTYEDGTDNELGTFALCDGAQGPQGVAGLNGADGAPGAPGAQGLPGMKGDTGDTGPAGVQGMKGDTGDTGPAGADGQDGPTYTGIAPVNVDNDNNEIGLNEGSADKDLLMWDGTGENWISTPPAEAVAGANIDNRQPYLVLNCFIYILLDGNFPSQNDTTVPRPYLGEIMIAPYNFAPAGWIPCDGQVLPINGNEALFSVLGTIYGGDGRTNFAVPDLRGRVPIHFGFNIPGLSNYRIGQTGGFERH